MRAVGQEHLEESSTLVARDDEEDDDDFINRRGSLEVAESKGFFWGGFEDEE